MRKGHSAVGARRARVCEGEELRNREKRAAEIVVRELKRAKPGAWGYVQAHEVWSTEEETHM